MGTSHYHLYFERRDARRNMARFYSVSIGQDLFGSIVLCRRWGRLRTFGQEKLEPFDSEDEALRHMLALCRAKRHRGYRPVQSRPE